jgi:hypothetical protein
MKILSAVAILALCVSCSATNVAKKPELVDQANKKLAGNNQPEEVTMIIPTEELAFVDIINQFDKKSIIAQLGEPAKADDVKIKGSNKIVASIWHYHYINTDGNGHYYQTTELDFIEGKVVQVVFINNDGSEGDSPEGQTYDIPRPIPNN